MQPDTKHMERTVLGAMMLENDALLEAVENMRPEDFALSSHQVIFRAMSAMVARSQDVNMATVSQQLADDQRIDTVGGFAYVYDLTADIPRRFSITSYRIKLREGAKLRVLVSVADEVQRRHREGSSLEDLVALLDGVLTDVQADDASADTSMAAALPTLLASFEPEIASKAVPTGVAELDCMTSGGLKPGHLWILGAHPGHGKTSLARQIVSDATGAGIPAMVFSIEMTKEQWLGLDCAHLASVPAWKLQQPALLSRNERQALIAAAGQIQTQPLYIDDNSSVHIRHLLARARAKVMQKGVRLVVVDYVGRVDSDEREIRHRIGAIAKALAEFAKRHGVAVLLLSQLARGGDVNQRPTMHSLKESGELEAHAHVVLLAHRPQDTATAERTGLDEIVVGKNRFGRTGVIEVSYETKSLRFTSRGIQQQRRHAA